MELNKAKENVKKDNVKPKEGRERLQMDSMKLNEAQGGQDPTCLVTRLESSLVPAGFLTAQFLQET